jgi:hypothetical protein
MATPATPAAAVNQEKEKKAMGSFAEAMRGGQAMMARTMERKVERQREQRAELDSAVDRRHKAEVATQMFMENQVRRKEMERYARSDEAYQKWQTEINKAIGMPNAEEHFETITQSYLPEILLHEAGERKFRAMRDELFKGTAYQTEQGILSQIAKETPWLLGQAPRTKSGGYRVTPEFLELYRAEKNRLTTEQRAHEVEKAAVSPTIGAVSREAVQRMRGATAQDVADTRAESAEDVANIQARSRRSSSSGRGADGKLSATDQQQVSSLGKELDGVNEDLRELRKKRNPNKDEELRLVSEKQRILKEIKSFGGDDVDGAISRRKALEEPPPDPGSTSTTKPAGPPVASGTSTNTTAGGTVKIPAGAKVEEFTINGKKVVVTTFE